MPEIAEFPDTFISGEANDGIAWIHCRCCGLTSYLLGDIENKYCGFCHRFHEDIYPPARQWAIDNTPKVGQPSEQIAVWRLGTEEQAVAALKRQGLQ